MDFGDLHASQLLDTLQIGVVVHSHDTSLLYANSKALEILRITRDQALGKNAFDPQWRFLDKNGKTMPVEDYPVNRVLATKSTLTDLQAGICDSSPQVTWVNCNAYPELCPDGEIERIIVNFIDITAVKEAVPYKEIVDLSKDAILVTDANHLDEPGPQIIYANQAFYELTGYNAHEVIGNTPRILQGDETDPETRQLIRDALQKKIPIRNTLLNYRKDGTPYWNELSLFPLRNDDNEVVNFVGVQRDASVRKIREERVNHALRNLRERNLELKEIDELKNQTMGIVAHDLRNPLFAVATSLDMIKECVDIEDPELISIIEASVANMNKIIEDLLESQLLHTADLTLRKENHCLAELIHEVQALNIQRARSKKIIVQKQIPEEYKAFIDYGKLLRAMDNLLSNAIKFSPKNSEVTIGLESIDSEKVRLFVQDYGPGLTEEDKSRVFKAFQRLSAQPTADEHSTGLGLSIVKKIAELHGGSAGVDSQHMKGARFYLDLPK